MLGMSSSSSFFNEPEIEEVLIESDAGLKREEEIIKQKQEEIVKEMKEELDKFKNVGRNEICLCGSNKKYKKCCLLKHRTW